MAHQLSTLPLRPAHRQTLGESVVSSLRDAIYRGLLKPGERIAEGQIASKLGISRSPIRDALAALEREGLVQRTTSSGAVVVQLTGRDLEEISSLRLHLEIMALRLAVERGTTDDFDRMAENIRAMETADEQGNAGLLDLEFHELFVRAARHERLLAHWLTLRAPIQLVLVREDLQDPLFAQKAGKNHRRLLTMLRARDADSAVKELQRQTRLDGGETLRILERSAVAEEANRGLTPLGAPEAR